MLLHQVHDVTEGRIFGDMEHLLGHDVAGVQAMGFGELAGLLVGPGEKRRPASPMLLGAEFRATQQITFTDHTDESSVVV